MLVSSEQETKHNIRERRVAFMVFLFSHGCLPTFREVPLGSSGLSWNRVMLKLVVRVQGRRCAKGPENHRNHPRVDVISEKKSPCGHLRQHVEGFETSIG